MRRRRRGRPTINALLGLIIFISLQDWIPLENTFVYAKKTSTRSGLVATTTVVGGGKTSTGPSQPDDGGIGGQSDSRNSSYLTPIERLRKYILNGYDQSLPPVVDHTQSVKIQIDLTYRQVLDLDEKNQILKSLIWFRQYWQDEYLTWDPLDYAGIEQMTIPSMGVWRPDITVYEEVGSRDYSPRLPLITVWYDGTLKYSEPTILETSCGVNTAFFPFDSQLCTMTFVSWSQPLTHIDLRAKRGTDEISVDSQLYFIASGEWVLQRFSVRKQISRYDSDATDNETQVDSMELEKPKISFEPSGLSKRKTDVPSTEITEGKDIPGNASDYMYAELRYSIVIRRNSSLYMQSMLFPSLLLTSVALLGFYLPPDSGERVGLQITILLTFMVFLLTVGEMFPASTGPYIGVYFVMSMAQLGVNILMTIIVLHIHFKPCVRDISSWRAEYSQSSSGGKWGRKDPDSMIPIRLRLFLQFCNRYVNVADDGAAWMLPITRTTLPDLKRMPVQKLEIENEKRSSESNRNDGDVANGNDSIASQKNIPTMDEEARQDDTILHSRAIKRKSTGKLFKRDRSKSKSPDGRDAELQKMIDTFRLDVKGIVGESIRKKNEEKDTEDAMEESMEKEQEEWKSVARAVDKLFFRFYIFLMIVSYVALAGVAIKANFELNSDMSEE